MKKHLLRLMALALSILLCVPSMPVKAGPVMPSIILTVTPLGSNGVYTSGWFDTSSAFANYVEITSYSDQASASLGLVVQESDDVTNINFTASENSDTAAAATLERLVSPVRKRFWRIVYTNGAVAQTQFEMTVGLLSQTPATVDNSGNVISPQQQSGWAVTNSPAAGSQATVAQAATPGRRHICTGFLATYGAIVAPSASLLTVQILDGGTVIWSGLIVAPAAVGSGQIVQNGLNLQGTSNTAMTIQFTAGVASISESVAMQGYDLQ